MDQSISPCSEINAFTKGSAAIKVSSEEILPVGGGGGAECTRSFWETRGGLLPSRDIEMWIDGLWLEKASSRVCL